jgi:capsular exopolysaccharide synthesis family protein
MISSPAVGEGKTTTAANLGVVLAQARKKVALVSADLRKPRVHRFFGLKNEPGIVDVLFGSQGLQDVIQRTEVTGLSLLSCGQIPARPAELLQSEAMGELLASLRQAFDFVVIDSAPALAVADALILAPVVDGVLFIADAQATSRQSVTRARNQLEQVGGSVIGGVLNDFDASKARGGYYYHYYYRYPYQQPGGGAYRQPVDGKRSAPDQVRLDT